MPDKPAGLPRFWNELKRRNVHRYLAIRNYQIKQFDRTIDWLEKGYEMHEPNIPNE